MSADGAVRPTLDEVRGFHLDRLNDALRRSGMYGGEVALRLCTDTMAFIDGVTDSWQREQEDLRSRDAANSLGVRGAFAQLVDGYLDDGAAASVYAEFAWRHGWLTVDRTLPDADHRRLREGAAAWTARDRSLDEVVAEFGPPSVLFGGSNRRYPKTLAYAAADRSEDLVSLHFTSTYDWDATTGQPEPDLVLIAVRHGRGPFETTFAFTPAGARHRFTGE
ncbi:hypothetical protein Cme02nite_35830 [Catellatospora methionotrophica]|uniref:Uncharacterized protein n=1 Tax=Catellatospora methionotrophica TaxID=121620 RepID=A0A8J3PHE0_9ACTN|nr:hypothetical protein [Catellatospora methionotrophica]GIG15251.1 hypothetical protein Cme02nite_35830 [Catellatospora methionotrophica]